MKDVVLKTKEAAANNSGTMVAESISMKRMALLFILSLMSFGRGLMPANCAEVAYEHHGTEMYGTAKQQKKTHY
jgi:hypothetical protein